MYFNQKAINNAQSHYETNVMELAFNINDGFNLKIKRDSLSERW